MELIFHGGAQEVGRSCIEIRTDGDRYLLDCGVKFHAGGSDYPAKVFDSRTVDGVFLSHAHLDHSGGLPFFEHYKMTCPIICHRETYEIAKILLKDSYKITKIRHVCSAFDQYDIKKVFRDIRILPHDKRTVFRTIAFEFFNAGHIPGSAAIKLEIEGKKILYTGDYNLEKTELMEEAKPSEWGKVDVLITEATYGAREHPNRKKMEDALLHKIQKTIERGGRVLLPVFAVGRAQEMLLMLSRRKWSVPIFMDGMAKKITRIAMKSKSPYVRNKKLLSDMYKKIRVIKNPGQRNAVALKPGIFVSTSGMLTGGPALSYLEHLYNDPLSSVLLPGYQVQNTTGWVLVHDGVWHRKGEPVKVQCDVHRYDFSAHLSRQQIQETIQATKPKIVIFNHGSPEAIAAMVTWTRDHTSAMVYAPMVGDQIDVAEEISTMHLYDQDDGYAFPHEHQHGDLCQPASTDYHVEHDE